MKFYMLLSRNTLDNLSRDEREFLCTWLLTDLEIKQDLSMLFVFKTKAEFKAFKTLYKKLFNKELDYECEKR